jgi:hypothetical protein
MILLIAEERLSVAMIKQVIGKIFAEHGLGDMTGRDFPFGCVPETVGLGEDRPPSDEDQRRRVFPVRAFKHKNPVQAK